ncbi:amyloid-beta A4 precursor protein-binding family B member 3 [Corythoichthys intestinalis]|uniref:amyloid-beta A4 precursor protein-binding family B member 3 n=1 Tax=Corythoichthys intestinalis TaxID=161448 RepID=UPI0025A672E1|nr:amyloid-beta A4 precursor protein-binding family B member 3 [Corythoichthys intestinalis]
MMGKDYMLAIIIVNCDDNIWSDQNLLPDPDLPAGWRTIRDSAGTYYWHVPSGTTQWHRPRLEGKPQPQDERGTADGGARTSDVSRRRDDNSQCFSVRSLGWLQVEEDDLSPGRGGLAVGDIIRQLSRPPGPGVSGEGRDMRLLLKRETLTLLDPTDHTPLYHQPIVNIRVWGVGGDNGRDRDFAFVAADKDSCVLKCHVFRCDAPAKAIAGALHRMCSQMMSQKTSRSLSVDSVSPEEPPRRAEFSGAGFRSVRKFDVHYVGNLPVSRAMGMEVLNLAIESIVNSTRRHEWEAAVIHVTDSFLSVFKQQEGEEPMWACQVRFLSFLGVGHDSRTFAVIADGGRQRFECHVFWCRPDAGLLSEAVQAACMVQYQKCLVAQTPPPRSRVRHEATPKVKRANSMDGGAFQSGGATTPRKGNGGARRGMMAFFDSFRNKRAAAS